MKLVKGLIVALLLVGFASTSSAGEWPPAGHLTGTQITERIAGKSFKDFTPGDNDYTLIQFGADGSLKGNYGGNRDRGSWEVDGDMFCRSWRSWHNGRRSCFAFVPDGQSIQWVTPEGTSSSMTLR